MNSDCGLQKYRSKIDVIDEKLLKLIARRCEVVMRIARQKKLFRFPAMDQERWQQVLNSRCRIAKDLGLNVSLVKALFEIIHEMSLEIESDVINNIRR